MSKLGSVYCQGERRSYFTLSGIHIDPEPSKNEPDMTPIVDVVDKKDFASHNVHVRFDDMNHAVRIMAAQKTPSVLGRH